MSRAELLTSVAEALESTPEQLPVVNELLADLEELGMSVETALTLMRQTGLPAGARVLDPGSGKGAIAIAMARKLALQVHGVDGFSPFVAHARQRASQAGVEGLCHFEHGDLRLNCQQARHYDAVIYSSVGWQLFGGIRQTLAALRSTVRPGGWILIEEGVIREDAEEPEAMADLAATRQALTAHGDRIAGEVILPLAELRAINAANNRAIEARARTLLARQPGLKTAVDSWINRQYRECEWLERNFTDVAWLLQRGPTSR